MGTNKLRGAAKAVTDLRPDDSPENPYYYTFRVQCTSCREVHPNWVSVSSFVCPREHSSITILITLMLTFEEMIKESNELSGSRGEANFVWRCKSCKRESSATAKNPSIPYTHTSPPKLQKIIEFDCRGLEFLEFKPDGEWLAKGLETTTSFIGIDLQDGEWFDYDEKAGEEVSIKDLVPINPRPLLQSLINEDVIVRLKWGQTEYRGRLVSVDSYMNVQLTGTEEFIDRKSTGSLGQVLIR
ncbi:MAG: hypothetical protein M1825_002497 [Sarcosagium campestre]|nr:MAG: hypothetical protein M1825_002497 [Sarcosagium campestre]